MAMLSIPSSEILREALADLRLSDYDTTSPILGQLRLKVCTVVDDLKAGGMRAEQVVLTVKGIVSDAQMRPGNWRLVDAIVKWSLEHYFKESADVPS